jgi:hypothetical protein
MAYLPALLALALAGFSLPARAQTQLILSCNGNSLPANPGKPDYDSACHTGSTARKKSGRLG